MTQPWHGVLVATALPWGDDGSPDLGRYAEHVRWLAANGCDGVIPNGSLGEYQTLSADERRIVDTKPSRHSQRWRRNADPRL